MTTSKINDYLTKQKTTKYCCRITFPFLYMQSDPRKGDSHFKTHSQLHNFAYKERNISLFDNIYQIQHQIGSQIMF